MEELTKKYILSDSDIFIIKTSLIFYKKILIKKLDKKKDFKFDTIKELMDLYQLQEKLIYFN